MQPTEKRIISKGQRGQVFGGTAVQKTRLRRCQTTAATSLEKYRKSDPVVSNITNSLRFRPRLATPNQKTSKLDLWKVVIFWAPGISSSSE